MLLPQTVGVCVCARVCMFSIIYHSFKEKVDSGLPERELLASVLTE